MEKRKPLKKSMSGEEVEFFILDHDGYMANDALKLIDAAKKKYPDLRVDKEAGMSMIETCSFPSVNVLHTIIELLDKTKKLIEVADENERLLFPLGTYPGRFKPEIMPTKKYKQQLKLFGKVKAVQAAQACGFHYHYTLPRGVFDPKKKFLKESKNSKITRSMMDSYNLAIAFDPAITTLLQSSPFVQGRYLAKDSRLLIYRGGKKLGYMDGKYSDHQSLGGLPPYKSTLSDLTFSLRKRQEKWGDMLIKKNIDPDEAMKSTNVLNYTWNPVKINPLGTLELRMMDNNHPQYTMAMASMLKFVFRKLYRDFYTVIPSDVGLHEPFKVEGNVIHVPPHTYVRNHLQKESAYKGMDSKEIHNYTKRFYRFIRRFMDDNYVDLVKPLYHMIEEKETVSDVIIKRFKKLGYGKKDKIPNEDAAEVALKDCEKLLEEVDDTEEKLYKAYNIEPKNKK